MLFDPARHEPLKMIPWDEDLVWASISRIVTETEARFTPESWWPSHPRDLEPGEDAAQPATPLYHGACGVVWALHHLQDAGAVRLQRDYRESARLADLLARNTSWLGTEAAAHAGSFMMGELPFRLLEYAATPMPATADRLSDRQSTYIDAVHGFVATAVPLIHGRHLLDKADWDAWQFCIENTVLRTATWEEQQVNWRAVLTPPPTKPLLMQ
jgi:hypothetical protein